MLSPTYWKGEGSQHERCRPFAEGRLLGLCEAAEGHRELLAVPCKCPELLSVPALLLFCEAWENRKEPLQCEEELVISSLLQVLQAPI